MTSRSYNHQSTLLHLFGVLNRAIYAINYVFVERYRTSLYETCDHVQWPNRTRIAIWRWYAKRIRIDSYDLVVGLWLWTMRPIVARITYAFATPMRSFYIFVDGIKKSQFLTSRYLISHFLLFLNCTYFRSRKIGLILLWSRFKGEGGGGVGLVKSWHFLIFANCSQLWGCAEKTRFSRSWYPTDNESREKVVNSVKISRSSEKIQKLE